MCYVYFIDFFKAIIVYWKVNKKSYIKFMVFNKQTTAARSSASQAIIDQGLRAYMLRVYN